MQADMQSVRNVFQYISLRTKMIFLDRIIVPAAAHYCLAYSRDVAHCHCSQFRASLQVREGVGGFHNNREI